jgi:hypothetical protein
LKLLEENTSLSRIPNAEERRKRLDKLDCIKLNIISTAKEKITKMRR